MSRPHTAAIADPPYPGQSWKHYRNHPDYAGEVNHLELMQRIDRDFDGFALFTSSSALPFVLDCCRQGHVNDFRVMAWVKPFAAFKANVPVAYAWEPVLVRPVRQPVVSHRLVMRDWCAESITMKRGLAGAKPERLCFWLFEVLGLEPDDHIADLFPGSGAITNAWNKWKQIRSTELPLGHAHE